MTAGKETSEELLELVREQQAFLELFVRSWVTDYRTNGGTAFCGKGCRNCCSLAVHTGFGEALAVAGALDQARWEAVAAYARALRELVERVRELPDYLRRHRAELGFCPLLNQEGACSVYPVRPLSCRSLISTRESTWCGTDFAQVPPREKELFLSGLDRTVVAFPSHYVAVLQECGRELEDAGARRMRELYGFSLYGNLGVQLELIRSHDLAQACLEGRESAQQAIARAGYDHPLLLTLFLSEVGAPSR